MDKSKLSNILMPITLIVASFFLAGILIVSTGKNPIEAYSALISGAFGSASSIIITINKAIPICLSAFAVSMSLKGGVFNIGVEGQFLMGASVATIAGIYIEGLPSIIHIPLALVIGAIAGGIWSMIPAVLFVKRGISLLVIHLLMNSVATFILQYFVLDLFASSNALVPSTESVLASAMLPFIVTSPNELSIAIVIVIVIAALLHFYYTKTRQGYELKAVGLNKQAAFVSGINTKKYVFLALVLGGAIAGIGGGLEILGNHHRLYTDFSPGYGYDGIPIALLSRGNPYIALIGSLLFGALRAGSINMRAMSGVSDEIVSVIQGVLILFISCQYIVKFMIDKKLFAKGDK